MWSPAEWPRRLGATGSGRGIAGTASCLAACPAKRPSGRAGPAITAVLAVLAVLAAPKPAYADPASAPARAAPDPTAPAPPPAAVHARPALARVSILVLGEAMSGPDGSDAPWPLLAELLERQGFAGAVDVQTLGIAHSRIADWLENGRARPRLDDAIAAVRAGRRAPYDFVLWQPGPDDAGQSPMLYDRQMMALSNGLRHDMPFGRLLVGIGSHCAGTAPDDPRLARAQHQIGDRAMLGIYPGLDLQTLEPDALDARCSPAPDHRRAFAAGWAEAVVQAHAYGTLVDRETLMTPFRDLSRPRSPARPSTVNAAGPASAVR